MWIWPENKYTCSVDWHLITVVCSRDGSRFAVLVAARCNGNTLVSINVVALHWAQLLLGWVTVC